MGHRHLFSTSPIFESEHDQNWNHMHAEQPYMHLARAGTAENGSLFYPVENMSVDGVQFASRWNPVPRSSGYSSSSLSGEVPPYQLDASGPSHEPFLHPSVAGTFSTGPESYMHTGSSSNYDRQTFHGAEGGFVDLTMGHGRGPNKRKSPGIPAASERGSTSRYYGAGSSSDIPTSELRQEKPNIDSSQIPWDRTAITPSYRGNGLSIMGEGSMRNVRSRSALDLESNLARTHLSGNPSHTSYSTGRPIDHSGPADLSGQNSIALTHDWSHVSMPPSQGRILLPDNSGYSHETNHFLAGSSTTNAPVDSGIYHHDFISSRNPVVPSFHGTSTQSARGVRSSYSQRSNPTFRASSSSLRVGHVASADEGLQLVAQSYPSRHPRPLSSTGWRNTDRNGRSRISNERYRPVSDEAGLHDRFSSEGYMIVDRSAWYGSRNLFDQHRDMRLDIDNMSYEELIALGERIGDVSTGLSEDLVSKCLTETIYCSSDQIQEEETCVICLEEYKDRDDVGALKICGHDYHVSCIRKWLSVKNLCPICKASATDDNMEEK